MGGLAPVEDALSGFADLVKGDPVKVFEQQASVGLSDIAVDCTTHNAVSFEAYLFGAGATVDITVQGSPNKGGNYLTLVDPKATQTAVSISKIIDVLCGSAWVKVNLANLTGTVTIWATPYISPGPTSLTATVQ